MKLMNAMLLVLCVSLPLQAYADLFGGDKRGRQRVTTLKAEARQTGLGSLNTDVERVDFRFSNLSAWLNAEGDWYINGDIRHGSLRCANYEVGIRFGAGNPGCNNVEWVTEIDYVSNRKQCNNATVAHSGGGNSRYLKQDFRSITCAERTLRCRGNCR